MAGSSRRTLGGDALWTSFIALFKTAARRSFADVGEMQAIGWGLMPGRSVDRELIPSFPVARLLAKASATACALMVKLVRGLGRAPAGGGRVAVFLLAYAAVWTISATVWILGARSIRYGGGFAPFREPAIGYFKFSPLINWVTAAWFAVMPPAGWSFYLLGFLNAALGMWFVWLPAFVVDQRRRIAAVALLGLMLVFTFGVALFNHNTFQLSLGRWSR